MARVVFSFFLIVLIGCGVQVDSEEEVIQIPTKVSVDIPNSLKGANTSTQKVKRNRKILELNDYLEESVGSRILTDNIYVIENIIKEIEFNIFLENSVINEVNSLCKDVLINQICTLAPNSVQLKVTEALVTEYEKFYPKGFRINEQSIGTKIPFGIIEFVEYDNNHTYQYSLNTNLTEISNKLYSKDYIFDANFSNVMQNVQWSEDNNTLLSTLTSKYVGEPTNSPWTLYYKNKPSIDEKMHLFHTSLPLQPNRADTFNFDLIKKYDLNNTNIFKLNDITITYSFEESYTEQLSSYGRVANDIGINRYSHNDIPENYEASKDRKDEIFDANGTTIASTYCSDSEYDECSLYDPSSWYIDSNNTAQFELFKRLDFNEIKITGGNLQDGEYYLLPSEFNENNLSIESVLTKSVGSFVVLTDKRQGAIYDSSVLDKLDTLKVLYASYNEVLTIPLATRPKEKFEVLMAEDMPMFSLFP